MTPEEIRAINMNRLTVWGNSLAGDHATPVILIGVGHDKNAGQLSICIPRDIDDGYIVEILARAFGHLHTGSIIRIESN